MSCAMKLIFHLEASDLSLAQRHLPAFSSCCCCIYLTYRGHTTSLEFFGQFIPHRVVASIRLCISQVLLSVMFNTPFEGFSISMMIGI